MTKTVKEVLKPNKIPSSKGVQFTCRYKPIKDTIYGVAKWNSQIVAHFMGSPRKFFNVTNIPFDSNIDLESGIITVNSCVDELEISYETPLKVEIQNDPRNFISYQQIIEEKPQIIHKPITVLVVILPPPSNTLFTLNKESDSEGSLVTIDGFKPVRQSGEHYFKYNVISFNKDVPMSLLRKLVNINALFEIKTISNDIFKIIFSNDPRTEKPNIES